MNEIEKLIKEARRVATHAYSPYSKIKFGVVLQTKNGKIFQGCNIENASYGLTLCAERVAIFNAISSGERKFKRMVLYSAQNKIQYPCGACRQVLHELAPNLEIILSSGNGEVIIKNINELLPHGFDI
jgi:cytidine deaminase